MLSSSHLAACTISYRQDYMTHQGFDTCVDAWQVAATVADRLAEKEGETALYPALQNLGRGIKSALPNLRCSIRHCIEVSVNSCNSKQVNLLHQRLPLHARHAFMQVKRHIACVMHAVCEHSNPALLCIRGFPISDYQRYKCRFSHNHVPPLQDGRVLDRASDQLSKVRGQRRDNMQSLRQSMNEWARKLAAQNVSEEALVVIRRDRLCVPVKAGRQVGTTGKPNVPHLWAFFQPILQLMPEGVVFSSFSLPGKPAVDAVISAYVGWLM